MVILALMAPAGPCAGFVHEEGALAPILGLLVTAVPLRRRR